MKFLISIDDTDNLESPGTGHLLEGFRMIIHEKGWGSCSRITRHQLFVHPDVPYTSHNSTMCFVFEAEPKYYNSIRDEGMEYLFRTSAPGSDPGLAMVKYDDVGNNVDLVSFGHRAKIEVLNKGMAYRLAKKCGVHLSEHGGTGDGVIGALAGIGLRLSGNDGRFRGKLPSLIPGHRVLARDLISHEAIDTIIAADPNSIHGDMDSSQLNDYLNCGEKITNPDLEIRLEGKVKTIFRFHKSVLLVSRDTDGGWINWSKDRIKVCF